MVSDLMLDGLGCVIRCYTLLLYICGLPVVTTNGANQWVLKYHQWGPPMGTSKIQAMGP